MSNNKRLGKGLEQLFSNERIDFNNLEEDIIRETSSKDIVEISLKDVLNNLGAIT